MTFKAAKCPNCAGDLQLPDDRDTAKCIYCGSDIIVREAMKLAGGVNLENILALAKNAEDSKKYDEAYKYYSQILEHDAKNIKAWIGKGITGIYVEDSNNVLSLNCFKNALNIATDKNKTKEDIINRMLKHPPLFPLIYDLDPNNITGLLVKTEGLLKESESCSKIIEYYEKALQVSNNDPKIIDKIIRQLSDNLEVDLSLERLQCLLNFAHKIKPEDRTLEKEIIRALWRRIQSDIDIRCSDAVFDFAHKIDPGDRPLEKEVLKRFLSCDVEDSFSRGRPERKRDACKLFHYCVNQIKEVDRDYIDKIKRGNNKDYEDIIFRSIEKRCGAFGNCFIATAAWGSPMAYEVILLREFRDHHLINTIWGNGFIKSYYYVSPPIARIISKSKFLKAITRQLLKPIIYMVKKYYL